MQKRRASSRTPKSRALYCRVFVSEIPVENGYLPFFPRARSLPRMSVYSLSMPDDIIVVKDLRKTYPGGTEAVRGVSFTVKAGEFFGFLGPNGAGKTTTINMLVNLVRRTRGEIKIDGLDLDKQPTEIYKRIGFAMQEVGLDETATAREMLQLHGRLYHLPKERIEEQIVKLLKLVELEKVA